MFQARVPDPTGANREGIWASPLRDVAHCTPYLIKVALEGASTDNTPPGVSKTEQDRMLCDCAHCLAKFISMCAGEDRPRGEDAKVVALRESGLLDLPKETQWVFGKWLSRALLGYYFDSIGEALHAGETMVGIDKVKMANLWPRRRRWLSEFVSRMLGR
jgi:hypothetical protein